MTETQLQLVVDTSPLVAGGHATALFVIMALLRKGVLAMNIADRIQNLRKLKGISQEELADKVGVSRQAVSKWESEQSIPDLEKIIIMSEYFNVTTDYILRGIEPPIDEREKSNAITSKILYLASTAFIAIGLLCAFGGWYKQQTAESIWGSMIIQIVGIVGFFIAKLISKEQAPFYVEFLNIAIFLFMPISMITTVGLTLFFKFKFFISPYPTDPRQTLVFAIVYIIATVMTFVLLRKRRK